jgi:hypothetical protein
MSRNEFFFYFEYHMFYVLYLFVALVLTLPRNNQKSDTQVYGTHCDIRDDVWERKWKRDTPEQTREMDEFLPDTVHQ